MARTHLIFLLFLALLSKSSASSPSSLPSREQEKDRIKALPGQPKVTFSQYSGYVNVNESHGRSLFYWLTESTSPHTKPLLLWLNGGPGCSSIAYGASEEIGPFRINKTGSSLFLNKFSWNKDANLLFLESPAGVGFSYTNTSYDLKSYGDEQTAQDNLIFLIKWLSRFPQYKYRDFYIAGESYAGHYVPQLAKKIHDYNKAFSKPIINLKGFMVGNAVTDNEYDSIGTVAYWWTHAIISDKTYKSILKNCNFTADKVSDDCDTAVNYAMNHEFGDIDQYSIYTPTCVASKQKKTGFLRMKNTLLRRRFVSGYDPCTESYAEKYYNRKDVQRAMHANVTGIRYKWTACSDVLIKNWKDSDKTMLPVYKELAAAGLRIWVFSGDTDSVVPVTATRFSLNHLNLPVKTRWYPWYSGNQVGGWTEVYKGLTFATVRGAGHEKQTAVLIPESRVGCLSTLTQHPSKHSQFYEYFGKAKVDSKDPMKEITDLVDPRIMFKHQSLLQDYHELRKGTEYKMRKLEVMKQKRSALDAQVRFLRRRYKHLKQDQTLETSPDTLRLSESGGDVKVTTSGKRKKHSGPWFDLKRKDTVCNDNNARSRGNEVLTPLPDLNDNTLVVSSKVSGFDLNLVSREEEEEPEGNGEATKKVMLGNGIDCEMKLPICRDVGKEISRAVKRKVSWQDPVALRV
ncbi:unnamed protein product [Brassica oleracea]